jgi:hypothetical protein
LVIGSCTRPSALLVCQRSEQTRWAIASSEAAVMIWSLVLMNCHDVIVVAGGLCSRLPGGQCRWPVAGPGCLGPGAE